MKFKAQWERMKAVSDMVAEADARRAEARRRKSQGRLTFSSVSGAVAWWAEARVRLAAPNGMHPRSEAVPTEAGDGRGDRVVVSVDGGLGGDIDGVFTTLNSIGAALERADAAWWREEERRTARRGRPPLLGPARYRWLVEQHLVLERPVVDIAKETGVEVRSVYNALCRAERDLLALLDGVVT